MISQTEVRVGKGSKLDNLGSGNVVELDGITSASQRERGVVLFSDQQAGLILVAIRSGQVIQQRSYFTTSYGVRQGTNIADFNAGSSQYDRLNKMLAEGGL